jgi:hypothetical protein
MYPPYSLSSDSTRRKLYFLPIFSKSESVRRIFWCNYLSALVNTSTSDHEKHGKVRQYWTQKVKTVSYLTYGQSCKHETDFVTSHEEVSWPHTLRQEIQNIHISNRV